MNLFNENKNNSYLFSSKESSAVLRTCTSCCPFDAKNLPHPQFNYSSSNQTNSDACCLSKLQVDCHIQCRKKKKKRKNKMKNKRYDSIQSVQSTKRSISSSNQLSPNMKRKKLGSSTNTNSHYIHNYDLQSSSSSSLSTSSTSDASNITQQSFSSNRSNRYYNKSTNAQQYRNIRDLKTSIDNLTQLLVHHQNSSQTTLLSNRSISIPSISFIDKLRRFFTLFKSTSKPPTDVINEECSQILKRNHLTKQKLLSIYHLYDKNETIFLSWLRTIMPKYFLPLLLNYVKHFDSISTDNE